jgi:hypothetical protein
MTDEEIQKLLQEIARLRGLLKSAPHIANEAYGQAQQDGCDPNGASDRMYEALKALAQKAEGDTND